MKTLYTNTCPSFHDTRKISRDKWLQNVRGEGMASTAGGLITYPETRPQFHDSKNITLQKINQLYCLGDDASGCVPRWDVGRVAYWDAGSIPDVDFVGSRIMATEDGTPVLVAGKRGNAWELTAGASMTAPDDSGLRLVNETFVVRFWIKIVTLPPVNGDIVAKLDTPTFSGWGVRMTSAGQLLFVMGNGSTFLSFNGPVVPNDAAFHHIAFTFNVSTQELRGHLDGVLTHSLTSSQLVVASNTEVLRVGGGASQPDHGFVIDEPAIWNSYWDTDCQVPADFNCLDCGVPDDPDILTDLLAYWKMDEATGSSDRQDSHTGNYDLVPISGITAVAGKINNAARLFGTPGLTLGNSNAAFGVTGRMTIAGWIYFSDVTIEPTSGGMFLVGKQDLPYPSGPPTPGFSTEGYLLYLNGDGTIAFWQGNGVATAEVEATETLTPGVWYFVVAGYDGTNIFIQVNNGSRVTAAGIAPTAASEPLEFGGIHGDSSAGGLGGPDAYFDEFGVWLNRALSATEADFLYNAGAGRTYPFV